MGTVRSCAEDLSLEPLHQLNRSVLSADLRQLQATMPLTPSVIEECRISVVVALLIPEERSPYVLDWFAQCREPLISSDRLITETHSALGIKERHHSLSSQSRQAAELLQDRAPGLRAGDALHLAVAIHSRCTQLASFGMAWAL